MGFLFLARTSKEREQLHTSPLSPLTSHLLSPLSFLTSTSHLSPLPLSASPLPLSASLLHFSSHLSSVASQLTISGWQVQHPFPCQCLSWICLGGCSLPPAGTCLGVVWEGVSSSFRWGGVLDCDVLGWGLGVQFWSWELFMGVVDLSCQWSLGGACYFDS